MPKIYLYLGRRDKTEVKLLSIFNGQTLPPTRIANIKDLNLPKSLETKISATIHQNRLMWEVWIEGAENTAQLRNNLLKRGYKDVPLTGRPLFKMMPDETLSGPVTPNYRKLPIKNRTMLQKKKDH